MTDQTSSAAASSDLLALLTRTGWQASSTGPAGTMWHHPDSGARVAVPGQLDSRSPEWPGVIARLAAALGADPATIESRVAHQRVDEAELRVSHVQTVGDSISLAAGLAVVESASKMLRASATTARGARATIGNYLPDGDRTFARARMGHTRHGSYVIPVLMPVPEPLPAPPSMVEGLVAEPIERRTMRTFAEALTAVSRLLVEPAVDPKPSVAVGLVVAGVSKQFLDGLHRAVGEETVQSLGATFTWAESVPAPSTPTTLEIPSAAAPLIASASTILAGRQPEPLQQITGPIVDWHREPADGTGWVGVQVVRHGHPLVVRVHLSPKDVERALRYAQEKRTAVVQGVPAGGRGRTVEIREPQAFASLDELMFPT